MKKTLSAAVLENRSRSAFITLLIGGLLSLLIPYAFAMAAPLPFLYTFNSPGTLYEANTPRESTSPYLWLASGDALAIDGARGATPTGALSYQLFSRNTVQNVTAQIYVNRMADNLSNVANRQPYIGESLIARYIDANNYYYAGIRADGTVVIKKKTNGVYQTLAQKAFFPGTYSSTNYDLIPLNKWIGLKLTVVDSASGVPNLTLATDVGWTGSWQTVLSVADDPTKFGAGIKTSGMVGIQSDYANAQFDNFLVSGTSASAPAPTPTPTPVPPTTYNSAVMIDKPVMLLDMSGSTSGSEKDVTGNGHTGTYKGGTPATAKLPNGDNAAAFNGTSQYLSVPSSSAFSIPTTGKLTWEAWIRPDTLAFPADSGDGYVDWMGKCDQYSPTCEWEARFYGASTAEGRPARLSAYVFNPSAGLGSAADWQPAPGVVNAGEWFHVVAEYDTSTTPSGCSSSYPGSIHIWVNGVKQDFASHAPTGCMSQYSIRPVAGGSTLTIGTMAFDTWFKGAVGKVAVYDYLLSQTQIANHFKTMTGTSVSGSCGATCTIP